MFDYLLLVEHSSELSKHRASTTNSYYLTQGQRKTQYFETPSRYVSLMFCEGHHSVWLLSQKFMFNRKSTFYTPAGVLVARSILPNPNAAGCLATSQIV